MAVTQAVENKFNTLRNGSYRNQCNSICFGVVAMEVMQLWAVVLRWNSFYFALLLLFFLDGLKGYWLAIGILSEWKKPAKQSTLAFPARL